jgi:hypothetical protein
MEVRRGERELGKREGCDGSTLTTRREPNTNTAATELNEAI